MDAADLRVFEAVARLGGMSRAAAELNTVQSNVTARIRRLEGELGTHAVPAPQPRRHPDGRWAASAALCRAGGEPARRCAARGDRRRQAKGPAHRRLARDHRSAPPLARALRLCGGLARGRPGADHRHDLRAGRCGARASRWRALSSAVRSITRSARADRLSRGAGRADGASVRSLDQLARARPAEDRGAARRLLLPPAAGEPAGGARHRRRPPARVRHARFDPGLRRRRHRHHAAAEDRRGSCRAQRAASPSMPRRRPRPRSTRYSSDAATRSSPARSQPFWSTCARPSRRTLPLRSSHRDSRSLRSDKSVSHDLLAALTSRSDESDRCRSLPPGQPLHATLAGLCAVLVGIGLARFAYTPLIPALIDAQWFTAAEAAYLGAANLAGYLAGALLAARHGARAVPAPSVLRAMMAAGRAPPSSPRRCRCLSPGSSSGASPPALPAAC